MKFDPKKTLFLIDGSSFLYRAYYGVRPLHTPEGIPVQAVYSFCRMIKKLISKFSPEYVSLVWDSKGKTTRHDMFEDYKATRQAPPSDIFDQKEYIVEFADLIDLHQIAQKGIEADDIMFSIAKERTEENYTVVLITSDKDMAQMLDDKTVMYDFFKDKILDTHSFIEKNGFSIEKIPFYYALLGDASDNIPGVRGIGKKGATDLVQQFDSLKDLYERIDEVPKERTKKLLLESKENAFLSEKLFLLQYHESGVSKKELEFNADNWPQAKPLFEKLNFKTLLKDLPDATVSTDPQDVLKKYDFKTVTMEQDLDELCSHLKKTKAFAFDTETTGLDPLQNKLVGISICYQEGIAYYIPCGHVTDEQQLSSKVILQKLGPIFADKKIEKYLHNAKFDELVLLNAGLPVNGVTFDTLIAARLTVKEWQRLGLKALSEHFFKEPMLSYEQMVPDKKQNFSHVPLNLATRYAAADAHQTFKLKKVLEKELKGQDQENLFYDVEMPLVQILTAMEATGISVDPQVLADLDTQVTKGLTTLKKEIGLLIEDEQQEINLNSPRQVEDLLFNQLQLPPQKKSAKKTGYSTDAEVLKALAKIHPVPALILKYRELFKLKSTYIDSLPTYINPTTKRIHTTFSQTVVATGRLASSNPNLQNIPINSSGYGLQVRAAFKPKRGNVFLSADYSQIELRVLAEFSQDKNLMNAFLQGNDIHAETASRLFEVALDQVTNEQRQVGKRINFSILYGLTPYGLSKDLDISFTDAKKYIEMYFKQYPGVLKWMESVVAETKRKGYVTTWLGRRRYIPTIYEDNKTMYEEAKRVAINSAAQGTAAEIMKLGMVNLQAQLSKKSLSAQVLLQIHDELLISVPKDELEATEKVVKQVLESVAKWKVPLVVTTRSGSDWKEVTK